MGTDRVLDMVTSAVPFNKPTGSAKAGCYLQAALKAGHLSGDGDFSKQVSLLLERQLAVARVLLTTSCTHALEMSSLLLDVGVGDEVIVPSFTFVSTANAFALRGAKVVFADIRPDTLNLDETQLEGHITERTVAIVPVHYAGVACEMDEMLAIARRHGVAIVEDNAHGLFGQYRGRYLGTLGVFATQSFHETKNFTCGEGGALLVNDARYVERAEIIREKGTDRSKFFRGQVDKYGWVDLGSSYLPSDLLAAVLFGQLEEREAIQGRRRKVWDRYWNGLQEWAGVNGIQLPVVPPHCEQAYHMFYMLMPSLSERQHFIAHLKAAGFQAVFHYLPLHLSPMGRKFGGKAGQCPITESVSDRLVRLPFFTDLTPDDQDRVIERVLEWRPRGSRESI